MAHSQIPQFPLQKHVTRLILLTEACNHQIQDLNNLLRGLMDYSVRRIDRGRRWSRPWTLRKSVEVVAVLSSLVVGFSIFLAIGRRKTLGQIPLANSSHCDFPAIFNFGDSNSDTGGKSAAFRRLLSPNGDTFFGKPAGRYSDGLVLVDFIAEKLRLPFLSAYLDSMGTNFRHGANFATGGSTIQPVDMRIYEMGFSPISLDIQLLQFEQFRARTFELYREGRNSYTSLPRLEDFSKALYTLDIGQNDLHFGFSSMTEKQLLESIPNIINQFSQAVEKLYQLGARAFWIHNTGPIGCLPYSVTYYPPKPENMDESGCVLSHNKIAQEFNRQLQEKVSQHRVQLPDAILTYTDIFSAKYNLISEAKKLGFANPLGYCCGHFGDYNVRCGEKALNGTEVFGVSCSNLSVYISWDGVHYSHAANRWIANQILDGKLSDPPIPITEACRKPAHL
ncbi:GDSL esterase/lipase At5g14450-like isoform X3 [Juglans microcarpa x Juglans regia]|uniref:GDSL esterase/lipase At5g14450-like isoform X3 n=1 Tax=Juglans microcarpa x Juglans regia TaxID=2249226 RepID=UPI001B7DA4CD|nr:GDSL esterase/lipase At5g14450-like isoform X3 [Juglans microcarpa x Juglans regia]